MIIFFVTKRIVAREPIDECVMFSFISLKRCVLLRLRTTMIGASNDNVRSNNRFFVFFCVRIVVAIIAMDNANQGAIDFVV